MTWKKVRRLGSGLGLAAMVGLVAGCGGDSPTDPAPTTGSVRVTTATTGADLDADGYMIAVDGGAAQAIGVNANVTVSNVTAASHSVTLSGLAANCSVSGTNPRSVTVAGGATAALSFDVACTSLTGNIEIAVNGTGASVPSTVNATIDGTAVGVVLTGSSATWGTYAVGTHSVEIDVPSNCTAAGSNPRTVTIPSGATLLTVTTTYELTCVSTQGYIEIAVNGTGASVPSTVNATIDGTAVGVVLTGSSATWGTYAVGTHSVEIDVPSNCTAAGSNPRTVTIPSGATLLTVTTTYELTCVSTQGYIEIAVNGTGASVPSTVNATIDGTAVGVVLTGSSATWGTYAVGTHSVEIDVPSNCTAAGSNPRTVTIPSGATLLTVTTTYELTCVSTQGYIEIAVNGTGASVPSTVNATIDGTAVGVVLTGSSATWGTYAVGAHSVEIDVPSNCTAAGSNPRTVTIPSGTTLLTETTTYDLTCG